jgi:hypothetical protein
MFPWSYKRLLLIVIAFSIVGCGAGKTSPVVPDYDKRGIRLIALMPVDNKTKDKQAARILRRDMLEELYFKGYPKIPFDVIDGKINEIYENNHVPRGKKIPPETIGGGLGVDAVMYCTLAEWETSFLYVYAPTTVSASFELKSAKTGDILWSLNHRVVKRNYDITEKRLEMKSRQSYESAVREVVDKAISTFPVGPDSLEEPGSRKGIKGILWKMNRLMGQ